MNINHYWFNDIDEIRKRLIEQSYPSIALNSSLLAAHRKWLKHTGRVSKYTPHQGQQEIARRLKQINSIKRA